MSGRNANGEGTVFQRKDGRWVAAVYAPTPDGDLRKIIKYAKNRTDANRKLRDGRPHRAERADPGVEYDRRGLPRRLAPTH